MQAYDKTARLLGLDLTRGGGPALEQLALEGDPKAFNFSVSIFMSSSPCSVVCTLNARPRECLNMLTCIYKMLQVPMRHRQNCNFSYAGLKNQVRMAIAAENMCVSPNCVVTSWKC